MTSGQKTAVSLLVSMLVLGACLAFALMGGFDMVEIQYYQPRVVKNVEDTLEKIGAEYDQYLLELKSKLAEYAHDPVVATYIERDTTEDQAFDRQKKTSDLFDMIPSLKGIRLIESEGTRLHFSTYPLDVLSESEGQISYRPYTMLNELPYFLISTSDNGEYASTVDLLADRTSVYYDDEKEQLVLSMPYFDHFTAYRGTLCFYVGLDDFVRILISKNLISLNTRCAIVSPENLDANYETMYNTGFIFDVPYNGRDVIKSQVREKWSRGLYGVEQLAQNEVSEKTLVLISGGNSSLVKFGWLCDEKEFSFSSGERYLVLVCIFVTVFLIVFLIFNMRHDDMTVIRGRVHKFQKALVTEYIERKENTSWLEVSRELNLKRQDVNSEIKKSLGRRGKKYSKELDVLLDESWNELFDAIGGASRKNRRNEGSENISDEKNKPEEKITPVVEVEELEEIPEAESVIDAEPVEELEEVDDAEPVEEVEELEEVEEAEPVEDLEALEEVEEAEPVEELEEVVDAEPVDDVEEVEELDEVAEAEPVEELPDEPVMDVEPVFEVPEAHSAPVVPEIKTVPEYKSEEQTAIRLEPRHDSIFQPATVPIVSPITQTVINPTTVEESDLEVLEEIGQFEKKTLKQDNAFAEKFSISTLDFSALDEDSDEDLKNQRENSKSE